MTFISCLTFITLLYSNQLSACDCIMHPIEKYIDTSEYIISAKVKKIITENESNGYGYKAILLVTKVYKGGLKKEEAIEFNSDQSDCAFKFNEIKNIYYSVACVIISFLSVVVLIPMS